MVILFKSTSYHRNKLHETLTLSLLKVLITLKVFFRGYTIAMVILYAITITITGSILGKLKVIVALLDKEF